MQQASNAKSQKKQDICCILQGAQPQNCKNGTNKDRHDWIFSGESLPVHATHWDGLWSFLVSRLDAKNIHTIIVFWCQLMCSASTKNSQHMKSTTSVNLCLKNFFKYKWEHGLDQNVSQEPKRCLDWSRHSAKCVIGAKIRLEQLL